jgi:hypothetical protein
MTLNQVINRIKSISLSHRQIRNFQTGLVSDFLTDHTTRYPSVFLQDNGGKISTTGHATTLSYRMFIMDLVNVSEDSKTNEQDVQSDMVSIAMDLITQLNDGNYSDWVISADNNLQLVVENDNDMHAGCIIDFSVRIIFDQNKCAVPSDSETGTPIDTDMKVYDLIYTATGEEGSILTSTGVGANVAALNGKKILFATRNNGTIFRVSSSPQSDEFTWDNTSFGAGTTIGAGERFLFLYRNY